MAIDKNNEIEIQELSPEELDTIQGGLTLSRSTRFKFSPKINRFNLSRDVYSVGSVAGDCGTEDSGAMGCPG